MHALYTVSVVLSFSPLAGPSSPVLHVHPSAHPAHLPPTSPGSTPAHSQPLRIISRSSARHLQVSKLSPASHASPHAVLLVSCSPPQSLSSSCCNETQPSAIGPSTNDAAEIIGIDWVKLKVSLNVTLFFNAKPSAYFTHNAFSSSSHNVTLDYYP